MPAPSAAQVGGTTDILRLRRDFDLVRNSAAKWAVSIEASRSSIPVCAESPNIPAPSRDPVSFGTAYDQRATKNTDKVVYFHQVDDRSYTMPPDDGDYDSGTFWWGDPVEAPSGGYSGECRFENNPLAVWTPQRGLVKISDDELRKLLGFGDAWFDRHGENREAARQAGVFWIIYNEDGWDYWRVRYLLGGYNSYCWIVPNPDEAPEEPCYICEDHGN